jgi:hypothetical protein
MSGSGEIMLFYYNGIATAALQKGRCIFSECLGKAVTGHQIQTEELLFKQGKK